MNPAADLLPTTPAGPAALPLPLGAASKIQPTHLKRLAIIYVRQSSPQQVLHNRESALLQYALRDFAQALGWPPDRILTIDLDQGRSARIPQSRGGFHN